MEHHRRVFQEKGLKGESPLNQVTDNGSGNFEKSSRDGQAASLRGPAAVSVGRGFFLMAGALLLVVCAVLLVVGVGSVANGNARINRLRSQGIPVVVTVSGCFGNIGGSGSNGAGFTCHGEYSVDGVKYQEVVESLSIFVTTGTSVRGVVDPSHHSLVELASAVKTAKASSTAYFVLGVLGVVLVALALALGRASRRSRSG
jgi:hypothetical protein